MQWIPTTKSYGILAAASECPTTPGRHSVKMRILERFVQHRNQSREFVAPLVRAVPARRVDGGAARLPAIRVRSIPKKHGICNERCGNGQRNSRQEGCARARCCANSASAISPLKSAPDRQPLWPDDLVGSITHTAGFCAAVVAEEMPAFRRDRYRDRGQRQDRAVAGYLHAAGNGLAALAAGIRAARRGDLDFLAPRRRSTNANIRLTRERLSFHDVAVERACMGSRAAARSRIHAKRAH